MTKRWAVALLGAVAMLALDGGAMADEIDELIAACKPSPPNDAAWAKALIEGAEKLKDSPRAQLRLYEAAYERGIKQASGYASAIRAAEAGMRAQPQEKIAWLGKLLGVRKLEWRAADRRHKAYAGRAYVEALLAAADDLAGADNAAEAGRLYSEALGLAAYLAERKDEIAGKLKAARERQEVESRLERHRRLLEARPENVTVREELIRLYVVELDKPAEAAKLLVPAVSEKWRTYLPLAARGPDAAAKDACPELGGWYASLADKATTSGKAIVLARAKSCYERFLSLEPDAMQRVIVQAKLDNVSNELAGLPLWAGAAGRYLTLELAKGVELELVLIPAGEFLMGSPPADRLAQSDERPQHPVTITKPFYMGLTEVTQRQLISTGLGNLSYWKGPDNPAEQLSWGLAAEFCTLASAKTHRTVRLPTEAEWEYASRAGGKTRHGFGGNERELTTYAWYVSNSGGRTHPVGRKRPNAFGLFDMYGNVWEWCSDWYGPYPEGKAVDPHGPDKGVERCFRGGDYGGDARVCGSADRHRETLRFTWAKLGFRVVVETK